jgi:hypothetical protein
MILELYNGWDVSKVTVASIKLSDITLRSSGDVCIGSVAVDPLIVLAQSGEVALEELYNPGNLIFPVATNFAAFLDALIGVAEFLDGRTMDSIERGDEEACQEAARKCAELAGGKRFNDFFQMLIG